MNYTPVIGLEIHVELSTKSKMFCGCAADYFGELPNTHTCPVCLGLPGALPVPNKKAIEWTVLLGLALNCKIPDSAKFDRKHYFYPDLPKGYQISQYDEPFAREGLLKLKIDKEKIIRIRRVHLEEDTGKLIHAKVDGENVSLIDFNRSGVPLVEVVTEPDIASADEAKIFLKKLQRIIRYLGISDCDMEKGSMRLEPNISLREVKSQKSKVKSELPNYKVEVKNINSFKFVARAIEYEIKRQKKLLENGEKVKQETRGFDENKGVTVSQRGKEEAHDYRYFPEPDIPPIRWEKSQIHQLADQIPELPDEKFERFVSMYQLPNNYADVLTQEKDIADYFEETIKASGTLKSKKITPKDIANQIVNKKIDITKVLPAELIQKLKRIQQKPTLDDDEIQKAIQDVLKENKKAVSDFKKGQENALMFLVGQVMRKTKGKANAQEVAKLLKKTLNTKP